MQSEFVSLLSTIVAAIVGLVALYFVIRSAVSAGIRDVRRRDAEAEDRAARDAARSSARVDDGR